MRDMIIPMSQTKTIYQRIVVTQQLVNLCTACSYMGSVSHIKYINLRDFLSMDIFITHSVDHEFQVVFLRSNLVENVY